MPRRQDKSNKEALGDAEAVAITIARRLRLVRNFAGKRRIDGPLTPTLSPRSMANKSATRWNVNRAIDPGERGQKNEPGTPNDPLFACDRNFARHLDHEGPERRGYVKATAVDPFDGGAWDVRISNDRMDYIARRSLGQVKDMAFVLPHVLTCPTCIFQGNREDGESEWLCYCGVPPRAFDQHGREILPPEGMVFLVFLNAERVAYTWRWECCDSEKSTFPQEHEQRFDRQVL